MLLHSPPPLLLKNPPDLQLKPVARGFTEPPMPPSLKEKIRKRASAGQVVLGLGIQISAFDINNLAPSDVESRKNDPKRPSSVV